MLLFSLFCFPSFPSSRDLLPPDRYCHCNSFWSTTVSCITWCGLKLINCVNRILFKSKNYHGTLVFFEEVVRD